MPARATSLESRADPANLSPNREQGWSFLLHGPSRWRQMHSSEQSATPQSGGQGNLPSSSNSPPHWKQLLPSCATLWGYCLNSWEVAAPPPVGEASVTVSAVLKFMLIKGMSANTAVISSRVAALSASGPAWASTMSLNTTSSNDIKGLRKLMPKMAFPTQCRNSNSLTLKPTRRATNNQINCTCLSVANLNTTPSTPSISPPCNAPSVAATTRLPSLRGRPRRSHVALNAWWYSDIWPSRTARHPLLTFRSSSKDLEWHWPGQRQEILPSSAPRCPAAPRSSQTPSAAQ